MKDFFKSVGATVVGIAVFTLIAGIVGVMSIVGMVAASEATRSVGDNSVLVLNLNMSVTEQSQEDIRAKLTGNSVATTGLNDIVSAIKKAKNEPGIKGIYIEAGNIAAGFASLQEIRDALADFRKSGKWIIAYGDSYSQADYYVASVANKVYINPQGMLDWHGIASQPIFYRDLFAKLGIKYQVVKVGTYKSATEVFTEDRMSDANRLQTQRYIDGLWANICSAVAKSRGVSEKTLNAYADEMTAFQPTDVLVKNKLVDGVMYADNVKKTVKKAMGIVDDDDDDTSITQLSVDDMANVKEPTSKGDAIAVYYAFGDIVQQQEGGGINGGGASIVATNVCKDLEALMNDDDIKAVVIRVNSGGGDAYASEQIWHQISLLKQKKPVVVSMGDYAASGAYYMSAPASWIVAQPNTLTGSIGIFAVFPDYSGLLTQKLGVKFDEVKTNRNAGFGNLFARPFNAEETAMLQAYVNRGYQLFMKRVADGRHIPFGSVDRIAQGRVWIAADAKANKLVDQIGGLDDAVKKAASLAKLQDFYTAEYPAPTSWLDNLLGENSVDNYLDEKLRTTLGDLYEPLSLIRNLNNREALQARLPFALNMK